MFDRSIIQAAMEDARERAPEESCGIVTRDAYLPLPNVHEEPRGNFRIDDSAYCEAVVHGRLQAVIHSHPEGQDHPSRDDMAQQIASAVPWGIIVRDRGAWREPFWFGDQVEPPPLIGRVFRHGVTDCYALVCDWFRLVKGIRVPPHPRHHGWWHKGEDLFQLFDSAGFVPIDTVERVGDCVVGRILGPVPNHCGVYVGRGLVLHHLANRLSRQEPLAPWMKFVTRCFRHKELAHD